MIVACIFTLVALVTAIVAIITAQEVINDKNKPGWNKLNIKGYKRDLLQLSNYEASVIKMKKEYEHGNDNTLTVIGQTLAKYGLRLGTTEKRLTKL